MCIIRAPAAGIVFALSLAFAGPAYAQQQLAVWHEGHWSGEMLVDSQGEFERCNAFVDYRDGISLSVSIHADGSISVRLFHEDWHFKPGQPVRIFYRVDNLTDGFLLGNALRPYQAIFYVPGADQFWALRHGRRLSLSGSEIGRWDLDLTDSYRALGRMAECVETVIAASEEPPARGGAQVPNVWGHPHGWHPAESLRSSAKFFEGP